MWFIVVAMLVILVLAGGVVLYVAFPHRGEDVPHVPWLGRLMRRGVDSAPTLENTAEEDAALHHEPLDLSHLHSRPTTGHERSA
jgi:hypothetical protein